MSDLIEIVIILIECSAIIWKFEYVSPIDLVNYTPDNYSFNE